MSAYSLSDFISGCSPPVRAFVTGGAMATARTDFNLLTQAAVCAFVANGGLNTPTFINSEVWVNNPDPAVRIDVDAYSFYSGTTFGYIAFLFQPKTSKWMIKSFKKNDRPDPRNLAIYAALKKSGIVN